jgi:AsmA protein
MNKWLKRGLLVLISVLIVLLLAVLALPFAIDPNNFKGALQRAAAAQNIGLTLKGPISWQFYPAFGLTLEDVIVSPLTQPEQALARAETGTASVALMPLFSGQVRVDQFVLNGLAVNLVVDKQGRGNWESLGKTDKQATTAAEPAPPPDAQQKDIMDIAVQRIAINQGSLSYQNRQTGQSAQLKDLFVQLRDVNLNSRPFPASFDSKLSLPTLANSLQLQFSGQLQANRALDNFSLENGKLTAAISNAANTGLNASLAGQLNLQTSLHYRGQLAVNTFNPKALLDALGQPLPATGDPAALTALALELQISGNEKQIIGESLRLTIDSTQINGSTTLALAETGLPKLELALTGDTIDLDRYLPPPAEQENAVSGGTSQTSSREPTSPAGPSRVSAGGAARKANPKAGAAKASATPLPLDSLRAINVGLTLGMDEILIMDMRITNPRLAVAGEEGLWQLHELTADFYRGKLRGEGRLDARSAQGDSATLQFAAHMDELAVQPLLVDLAEFEDLSGTVSGELQARTRASTNEQLLDALSANFQFTSPRLTFQGINAEYFYCQMATRLNDGEMPGTQWPARTDITGVEGELTFGNNRLDIAKLVAHVENLMLTATGYVDLGDMRYRIRLPMRLEQQQTSTSGCLVESGFLQNREVDVLGCAGSLTAPDLAKQCGLDNAALTDLAKQAVRYNIEKHTEEKKRELREDLEEKLREKLGGEKENGARDLLRGLFNR